MMICHSWSFAKYDHFTDISKIFHTQFSENSYDEFMYLIDFIQKTEVCEFTTCKDFYEKVNERNNLLDIVGETVEVPLYELPPSYGVMRGKKLRNFVDLEQGNILSDGIDAGFVHNKVTKEMVQVSLNTLSVPKKEDSVQYNMEIPYPAQMPFSIQLILSSDYFRENFFGRNRLKYSVLVNQKVVFYDFITNPAFEEIISYSGNSFKNNIDLQLKLECLEDEMPWGWGGASKTTLKHVYLDDTIVDTSNKFLLFDNTHGLMKALTANITLLSEDTNAARIIYHKVDDSNNYLQFFDGKFTCGPSNIYAKECMILSKNYVVINFKARSMKRQEMLFFFMQYDGLEGKKIENTSQKIIMQEGEKYYSLRFALKEEAEVYKIAMKLGDEIEENEIVLDEMELIFH